MFASASVRRAALMLFCLVLVFSIGQDCLLACPTCKDGLAGNDPEHANLVRGYFWSIVFMMSMPFLIFASLGTYFYWQIRRARKPNQLSAAVAYGARSG